MWNKSSQVNLDNVHIGLIAMHVAAQLQTLDFIRKSTGINVSVSFLSTDFFRIESKNEYNLLHVCLSVRNSAWNSSAPSRSFAMKLYICIYIHIYIYTYTYIHIQGVTGGKDQTSGGCSLC